MIGKEGGLIPISGVTRGKEVLAVDFLIHRGGKSYILSVGTKGYLEELARHDSGFVREGVIYEVESLSNMDKVAGELEEATKEPELAVYLVEQKPVTD